MATGTAAAAPACADFHWIGAAGSGQRDGAGLNANGGMGDVVYQSYQQLRADLLANGRTITAEAVQYPAAPVALEGGLGGWLDFMDSVDDGTDAAAEQFEAFTERCPNTKVVLAGYSQGAMVIHRNLHDLADDPHVAAALLIADGDRLPVDTTINSGIDCQRARLGQGRRSGALVSGVHRHLDAAASDRRTHRQCLRCRRSGVRLRPGHHRGVGRRPRDSHLIRARRERCARLGRTALRPGNELQCGADIHGRADRARRLILDAPPPDRS